MAQKKRKRNRCTANSVPLAVKIAQQRKAREQTVAAVQDVHQHDAAERMLYFASLALNEEFGFGRRRIHRFLLKTVEISQEYTEIMNEDGQDVADEKLRRCIVSLYREKLPSLYSSERKGCKETRT